MQVLAPFLLIGAGLALIAQNLIMSAASARLSSVLIPLVLNSAVGLVLLSGLLLWQSGAGALRELASAVRPLQLLPGLLGSFFVFASLTGYRHLGSAATIAILVASQLVFGLGADFMRAGSPKPQAAQLLGVGLLILGSWLVLFRKG